MNIASFKNALKGGGARNNLFEVEIEFPTQAAGADVTRLATILIKAAQIPPSTLGIIEQPFRGRVFKVPGDRIFPEWTITVLNDTDFAIRDAFERWSNAMNSHVGNISPNSSVDLMRTAAVYQLDRGGNRIKEYILEDVWPSEVSTIELAHESTNQIEEFTVMLAYSQWRSNTTS